MTEKVVLIMPNQTKYHVGSDGSPAICRAKPGNCPKLKTVDGFHGSYEQVESHIKENYSHSHGEFSTIQKKNKLGHSSTKTVHRDGRQEWRNTSGRLHRVGFPAVIWPSGAEEFWEDGELVASTASRPALNLERSVLTQQDIKALQDSVGDEEIPAPAPRKKKKKVNTSWKTLRVPSPEESLVIVPPRKDEKYGGYLGGFIWIGGKVDNESYMSSVEAAKGVRKDIKEAINAGELPADLNYSVRSDSGRGYSSVNIVVGTNRRSNKVFTREEEDHPRMGPIMKYLSALGEQYSQKDINSQVDYFNVHNTVTVRFRNKYDK